MAEPAARWIAEGFVLPPRGEDLPHTDAEPMESGRHAEQAHLLWLSLRDHRPDVFVAANMFLYFSATQARNNDFRGPDVFAVVGAGGRERKSWVVWEEDGRVPDVVVELGVPELILFAPFTAELTVFRLHGRAYRTVRPNPAGRVPIAQLGLEVGLLPCRQGGIDARWLRWFDPTGAVLVTPEERAAGAEERAAAAEARAQALERELAALRGSR